MNDELEIGRRYGFLRCLNPRHSVGRRGATYGLFQCACGDQVVIVTFKVAAGTIKSCGKNSCYRNSSSMSRRKSCRALTAARLKPFLSYRGGAHHRNKIFTLPEDRFYYLVSLPCFYCGLPPSNIARSKSAKNPHTFKYSGLDRYNNSKGYVTGNVVPCCKTCNSMKKTMTHAEFIEHCRRVVRKIT